MQKLDGNIEGSDKLCTCDALQVCRHVSPRTAGSLLPTLQRLDEVRQRRGGAHLQAALQRTPIWLATACEQRAEILEQTDP